jgi:hypothetical protein
MVTLTELENQARILDHQADAFSMLARSLRWSAKAHAEGHATGLREAAASLRRLEDRTINDSAHYFQDEDDARDYFADQTLGILKEEAADRADLVDGS